MLQPFKERYFVSASFPNIFNFKSFLFMSQDRKHFDLKMVRERIDK